MCKRFFSIPYDQVLTNSGKMKKEFLKLIDAGDISISLHQDSFDKMISDLLEEPAKLYFQDNSVNGYNEEGVIRVLHDIWEDQELQQLIKKLLYRKLYNSTLNYDKMNLD